MMKWIVGTFLFCWAVNCNAQQNLVPNHSFEEYTSCPDTQTLSITSTISVVTWNVLAQTPDYYNVCGTGSGNIYNAWGGGGAAQDGDGYIGLITWLYCCLTREIVEVQLLDTLKANHKYNCSLWILKPDSFRYATKSIGMYFSQNKLLFDNNAEYYVNFSPQVKYTGNEFLNSNRKWINVENSFIAQGLESHVAIGNFDDDLETQLLFVDGGMISINSWNMAYYYIDNVSVVEDTSYHPIGIEEEQLERLKLTYHGGNLHLQGLLFQNRETELFLYSYDGKQVGSYTLPKGNNSIPLKLPQGIYLYSLKIGEQALKRGKIWVGGE